MMSALTRLLPFAAAAVVAIAALASLQFASAGDPAPDFVVNTTSDDPGATDCTAASDGCSLRGAITQANLADGGVIGFAIGSGPQTITVDTMLPELEGDVTIDGSTQPGFAGTPLIELAFEDDAPETHGLVVAGDGNAVRSLKISGFTGAGILIKGSANTIGGDDPEDGNVITGNNEHGVVIEGVAATDNVVTRNYIGLAADGETADGNGLTGVMVRNGATGNWIGTSGRGNVISGNTDDGVAFVAANNNPVRGNRIGTDADGATAVPNGAAGVAYYESAASLLTRLGEIDAGSRNIISGNALDGVLLTGANAAGVQIWNNHIGVAADGTTPLPNGRHGVFLDDGARDNTIGGEALNRQNIISHNTGAGVSLSPTAGTDNYIDPNIMHSNGSLGIDLLDNGEVLPNDVDDLDEGPNDLQNYPVITSAAFSGDEIIIQGYLNSRPGPFYNLFFFSNDECDPSGHGEGKTYLGILLFMMEPTQTTRNFSRTVPVINADERIITSTASNPESTSEFSECVEIEGEPPPTPGPTPTPTGTPTPTPTGPTPEPTATPTGTPTPAPTPGPTPAGPIPHGDVDCDGNVDTVDALKVLRHVAELSVAQNEPCPDIGTPYQGRPFGDINCDGGVNPVDSLAVLRYVADLPPLPAGAGCPAIGTPV